MQHVAGPPQQIFLAKMGMSHEEKCPRNMSLSDGILSFVSPRFSHEERVVDGQSRMGGDAFCSFMQRKPAQEQQHTKNRKTNKIQSSGYSLI